MATWLSLPIISVLPSYPHQMYLRHRLFSMPGAQRPPHRQPRRLAQRRIVATLARLEIADRLLDALAKILGQGGGVLGLAQALHGHLRRRAQPAFGID